MTGVAQSALRHASAVHRQSGSVYGSSSWRKRHHRYKTIAIGIYIFFQRSIKIVICRVPVPTFLINTIGIVLCTEDRNGYRMKEPWIVLFLRTVLIQRIVVFERQSVSVVRKAFTRLWLGLLKSQQLQSHRYRKQV